MPPAIRHITHVDPKAADGVVGEVYRQAKRELGAVGAVFFMLSPAPELLAPLWSTLRESLFVGGPRERTAKEVVATAIAVKNGCRFCTDAHVTLLHALGEHDLAEALREGRRPGEHADAAEWALAPSLEGPFPAEAAPRFIGTALVFEFITRMVKVMAVNAAPMAGLSTRLGRSVASRLLRERVTARLEPGESLALLRRRPRWLEEEWPELDLSVPSWAGESPVGPAWAHLRATASRGRSLLAPEAAAAAEGVIDQTLGWWGTSPVPDPPEPAGLERLSERAALGARLVAAAALDPGSVRDADVAAWRGGSLSDHSVVFLVAFAAARAAGRVEAGLSRVDHAEKGRANA